jgi:tripartite-type tricarboxylate transporter receptor subunit TctC
MIMTRFVAGLLPTGLMILTVSATHAQDFPNRPIRVITSLPGGGSDFGTRLIAQGITGTLGQPVIVENRPSNLTGDIAMKAQGDGYTLLVEGNSFWFGPLIYKTSYDVLRDFSPITIGMIAPNIIVVHPSIGVTTIPELIALAKAKPGQLNYASSGIGSSQQFGAEMLNLMAGIKLVHVPYKGSGLALTGILGGEVQVMSASAASASPHIKGGKLRALAVTSAKPSALLPGLPTVASFGLPGFDLSSRTGVFAAGKPPKAIIERLNKDIARALSTPDIRDKFFAAGVETNTDTADESVATIKTEVARMAKIVQAAGMKVD